MTNTIFITDLHLGCRNGSITWMKDQFNFLYSEFIPYVASHSPERVICLGDVFDVRHAVQTNIALEAQRFFNTLGQLVPVYIVAGNHDFFSPATDEFCALNTILGKIDNVHIIDKNVVLHDFFALVPWYVVEEKGIDALAQEYNDCIICTHTDLSERKSKIMTPVFTGHIHFPVINSQINLYNLGSCFALNFADCAPRYFYDVTTEGKEIIDFKPIENQSSIRFWRFHGVDDITDCNSKDFIEWYLPINITKDEKKIVEAFCESHPNITIYKTQNEVEYKGQIDLTQDMHSIIESLIPDNLKETFQKIK